jgi:ElaB/YqjD/DUF883 family membrane-anchored ribosome-binding protein
VAWFLHRNVASLILFEQRGNTMSQTAESTTRTGEHHATDHLAAKAHDTIDRVADTAGRAEQNVRASAARAKEKTLESEERAMEMADETVRRTQSYIQQNPMVSAGLALAAGFLLSSILRR